LSGSYIIVGLIAVDGETSGFKVPHHILYDGVVYDDIVAVYPPRVGIGTSLSAVLAYRRKEQTFHRESQC
jgi:hypothetical protein